MCWSGGIGLHFIRRNNPLNGTASKTLQLRGQSKVTTLEIAFAFKTLRRAFHYESKRVLSVYLRKN